MIKITIMMFVLCFMATVSSFSQNLDPIVKPQNGFVPDAATAIKIAEAVWLPIYGARIYEEKPFRAELKDGIWYVNGSLKKGRLGGVAHAEISQENGCILRIIHGK